MYVLLTALTVAGLWAAIDGPLSRTAFARTTPTNPLENETPAK